MGVELVWSASPLGGTSSMPSACVESGSGARSFPFRAWRISRSIIREVSARIARRSRHGKPRYRSAGIVTLEPSRLVAPWIGHTYSGASPDRSCARASRRIGTESNPRGLGRSRQSWIGVCLMAASCHADRRRSWAYQRRRGWMCGSLGSSGQVMPRSRGMRGLGTRPIRSMSDSASSLACCSSASASLIQLTSRASARGS